MESTKTPMNTGIASNERGSPSFDMSDISEQNEQNAEQKGKEKNIKQLFLVLLFP